MEWLALPAKSLQRNVKLKRLFTVKMCRFKMLFDAQQHLSSVSDVFVHWAVSSRKLSGISWNNSRTWVTIPATISLISESLSRLCFAGHSTTQRWGNIPGISWIFVTRPNVELDEQDEKQRGGYSWGIKEETRNIHLFSQLQHPFCHLSHFSKILPGDKAGGMLWTPLL